jgi:hypothetical protein
VRVRESASMYLSHSLKDAYGVNGNLRVETSLENWLIEIVIFVGCCINI